MRYRPDGATWFFKHPNPRDPWGIRVSCKALSLALYGLGGTRAHLFDVLDAIGIKTTPDAASISRVDYAIDVLYPGFELDPDCFVMHSHTNRTTQRDFDTMRESGRSGRVTSVTIGKMPGRQVIVYDKRRELIDRKKPEWWKIYNDIREAEGKSLFDPTDRGGSQIWRTEFRAGKTYLKEKWGITTWADLDEKIGDLFMRATEDIRYTIPLADPNRSRWPNDPLWDLCREQLSGDLFEMMCRSEPDAIKEVIRERHAEMLASQFVGLSASWGAVSGYGPDDAAEVVEAASKRLSAAYRSDQKGYRDRMERAAKKYAFIGE